LEWITLKNGKKAKSVHATEIAGGYSLVWRYASYAVSKSGTKKKTVYMPSSAVAIPIKFE
jgi:hypothetical protein